MERKQMVDLVEFISQLCPAQKINRGTAVAWYELPGFRELDYQAARNAVISLKHSEAWIDPAAVIAEVRRTEGRSAKPYDRTAAEAMAASSLRELPGALAVPPTAEYQAAKEAYDARAREREQAGLRRDWTAERRANDWLHYMLNGVLPPETLQDAPPLSRWVSLPDDPPPLRIWLARQAAKDRAAQPGARPER